MSIISFENVHYTYPGDDMEILCGIDLAIEKGQFTAVLGPNGSGKSTLAKHMNAILVPDEGRVLINGIDTADEERVLDEPTAMLDPQGRQEVISTVTRLCREKGMTVVLITHHMDECIGADRLIVMSNGSIIADGTPGAVFSDVALMEREGLSVPETVRLMYELNSQGFDLPLDALSPDECAKRIAESLS